MSLFVEKILKEAYENPKVFYHGSTDRNFSGRNGIHVGTYEAARQALNARIGVPAEGDWDGTRTYNETLLAGKQTLRNIESEQGRHVSTGFNCGKDVPINDYYPDDRQEKASFSDRNQIPMNCKPEIFKVQIIGPMTNGENMPHADNKANGLIKRSLNSGKAKSGFYYKNDGEDAGSISAVVPDGSFLKILN